MASVTYDSATRVYTSGARPAIDGLHLEIEDGEFLVLVGPSGCGKSTALRMLAGLEDIDAGRILIGDHDVSHLSPKERDIAMVFQNYALYPHMSVEANMGFALKIAGTPKEERRARVREAAKLLDLEPFLDRKPKALSGGQRQRVAMGRAIVRSPQVFLMDEPLSNLDAKLRVQTRTQIAALTRRLGVTTVYVTHDQVEAMTMGDRVCVLKDGVLQQVATPRRLYEQPANLFVAGFIGSPAMNLFRVRHDGSGIFLGDERFDAPAEALQRASSDAVVLGVRPEDIEMTDHGLEMEVELTEELGADAHIFGTPQHLSHGQDLVVRVGGRRPPQKGDRVRVSPMMEHIHLFDAETGLRLNGEIPEGTPHAALSDVEALQDAED
ncbi:ABC transporter ATP-binding protein [Nesterenkonia aerolata]|uniref:Sn-glycerol-3-phosphate ABC transporter ATP-binding protein UgpC n=1 Tax=Nesterenkonia aerolata TaxID=3074079 RepID=A0ABU2DRY8_9MICC|nr:sn-glycerol-3-phosphate ABC transporter ATP-binding protein UgpC [Nesterenkonia sp. LY-0111]MDR8019265.1 sn-glycerol-3-phosphate ABC transporter ATP-binding protein UgpC [Nesterenkonia sp. LY-0111]